MDIEPGVGVGDQTHAGLIDVGGRNRPPHITSHPMGAGKAVHNRRRFWPFGASADPQGAGRDQQGEPDGRPGGKAVSLLAELLGKVHVTASQNWVILLWIAVVTTITLVLVVLEAVRAVR